MAAGRLHVDLELPEELVALWGSAEAIAKEIKELLVMELLRRGEISQGKAAEMLGISRWDLVEVMAKHEVPSLVLDPAELDQDLENLEKALHRSRS